MVHALDHLAPNPPFEPCGHRWPSDVTPAEHARCCATFDRAHPEYSRVDRRREAVEHPAHYQGPVEVIDVIEGFGLGFALGNVVKYVLRAERKGAARVALAAGDRAAGARMTRKARRKQRRMRYIVERIPGRTVYRVLRNGKRIQTNVSQERTFKTRAYAHGFACHRARCEWSAARRLTEVQLRKLDGTWSRWGERSYGHDPRGTRG
jgi:hypothetical protein